VRSPTSTLPWLLGPNLRRPYTRGLARRQLGDVAAGNADITAALTIDATMASQYARRGVKP
jgi:hypothetical protein